MSTSTAFTAVPMRAARWSAGHPWAALFTWIGLVLASVGLALAVPTVEANDADYRLGDSGHAHQFLADAGFVDPDTEIVLISAGPEGSIDRDTAERTAAGLREDLRELEGVAGVASPQWSPDGSALLVEVRMTDEQRSVDPLLSATADAQEANPGLTIRETGDRSLDAAIDQRVGEDLAAAEGFSLPLTLVLMLIAFGALIGAGIPVLLAFSSVAATIGLMAPLSHLIHAEGTVASMIVLIGMAVGVDYSLFYLKREREERAAGRTTAEAIEIAARTSGHSILVSGGAVIASMTGLFVMGGATFNSLAVGSILVVGVAVLGSITVLPALLILLGPWVDRPRIPLLWRLNARIGRGGMSRRLLAPVLRRPAAALVLSGLVVAVMTVPALGLRIHSANLDTLPESIPEVGTMRDLTAAFPLEGASATVVAVAGVGQQSSVADALLTVRERAVDTGYFLGSDEAPDASDDGTTTRIRVAMPFGESDVRVDRALRTLRDDVIPAAFAGVDAEVAVGGGPAESLDYSVRQSSRLPLVVGFVLILTFTMMWLTFRSLVLAAVSTLLNLASVGVAFGFLCLVFQHGWGSRLLGFTSPGFVIDWLPLFVLVVLVGLSMDYHVFVVSRIREHVGRGLSTRAAVEQGIADTAGVVTSAAAVMVSIFAIFATLSMLEMKMLGVGLSAAILLDATLVRLVMLPAAMVLLGERAWWPARPDRTAGDLVEPSREAVPAVATGLSPSPGRR